MTQTVGAPAPTSGGGTSRVLAILAIGVLVGFVGGFVAGRSGRHTTTVLSGDASPQGTTIPPSVSSSRTDPVAIGKPVDVGNGWRVTSHGIVRGAEVSDVYALPKGMQWVTISLDATYVDGDKAAQTPFFGLDLSAVGPSGVSYTETDSVCEAQEPRFNELTKLYKGGTESGNICLAVKPADVPGLVLVAEPSLNTSGPKTFLALH